jgi:hypothetical protein
MAGHNRSKNGVAWLAYVPAIHVLLAESRQGDVDARGTRPGMTTVVQKEIRAIAR